MLIWDLPTRLFHWLLALSFIAAYVTATLGPAWMDWHFRAGYLLAALLLFRLVWGLIGSDSARFRTFLRGPRQAIAYWRGGSASAPYAGHNPAGGWMVLVMLITLALISVTGFFADDLILFSGPLAACVSGDAVDRHTRIHLLASNLALGLIALHLLAIAYYQWRRRQPLFRAMVTGRNPTLSRASPLRFINPTWALAVFLLACAAMWALDRITICG